MYKHFLSVLSAVIISILPATAQDTFQRPKLVVGVVIDQMRWDYLYRYQNRFEEDGFKRLMRPYMISAALISIMTFFLGAYVIPKGTTLTSLRTKS